MSLNKKDIQAARDILKSSPSDNDFMQEIKKKRFRLSGLYINHRNAVHWDSKGLFLNKKPEGTWQHLDLSEAVWILIVQNLREYNFRLELIIALKDNFLNQPTTNAINDNIDEIKEAIRLISKQNVEDVINTKEFNAFINSMEISILDTILMDIIHLRNHYRILFTSNGGFVLVKDDFLDHPLQDRINAYMCKSHFSLSINEIVAELLGKMDLNLAINSYKMISQEEMQILTILRTENIQSVEIRLDPKTNNIEFINYTETIQPDAHQRLYELIMRNGYQEITITTQNGRIAHCVNKIKYKTDTVKNGSIKNKL
jgi:hypothetical protein